MCYCETDFDDKRRTFHDFLKMFSRPLKFVYTLVKNDLCSEMKYSIFYSHFFISSAYQIYFIKPNCDGMNSSIVLL